MLPSRKRVRFATFLAAGAVLVPRITQACEVCFGSADSPWIDAAQASVWLMLGVTLSVQVAFAVFFIKLRNRAKAAEAQRSGMKLVDGKGAV